MGFSTSFTEFSQVAKLGAFQSLEGIFGFFNLTRIYFS
ncbi:hypothetical protein CKA32_000693 [Geitlerinema sp. FC II]|nr:hypothetical protein CKA32_000693 [Geitlerinema sp. FC II]